MANNKEEEPLEDPEHRTGTASKNTANDDKPDSDMANNKEKEPLEDPEHRTGTVY